MKSAIAFAGLLAFGAASAAGTDDLWEVTTQMNMAGMPPGMGAQTQQICQEKTAGRKPVMPEREKCKVTDYKESGNRVTISVSCPEGSSVIEQTFNSARTEYKGTMKMKTREGDMAMTMNGRKVGTCDARQAKAATSSQQAAIQQQMEEAQGQAKAATAKQGAAQVVECRAAVETMEWRKLGLYANCDAGGADVCKMMLSNPDQKPYATQCIASRGEYCKRFQTMDGFARAKGDEQAAKMCNVSVAQLKAANCPRAAREERLDFLVEFCDAEAKPVAQANCAGREYTSRIQDKYSSFCLAYYTKHMDERPAARPAAARTGSATTDAVQQGVQQGINKLKGLFGR